MLQLEPSRLKEKVILLKKTKYGEADLILQALSSRHGKLSILARGALRSKRRFGGGILEPTHYIEAQLKKAKRDEDFYFLEEATLLNDFGLLREDYDRLEAALKIMDVATKVCQHGDPHSREVYDLVGSALKMLSTKLNVRLLQVHFSIRFFYLQGVLEKEDWMLPFLATPMVNSSALMEEFLLIHLKKIEWVHRAMDKYLIRGEF